MQNQVLSAWIEILELMIVYSIEHCIVFTCKFYSVVLFLNNKCGYGVI